MFNVCKIGYVRGYEWMEGKKLKRLRIMYKLIVRCMVIVILFIDRDYILRLWIFLIFLIFNRFWVMLVKFIVWGVFVKK